ncbi:MAG: ferredoxin [Candidatus Omnitrophota bacterium]
MKVTVNEETCIGCGLCVQVAPDIYEMKEDKAMALVNEIPEDKMRGAQDGSEQCPVAAIEIS